MKKIFFILVFVVQLFSYDFILLNSTTVDDDVIISTIKDQIKNYYNNDQVGINFSELDNKNEIIKLMANYDYTDDKQVQEELISNNEDLEDDLRLIFKTEYFLIVSEDIDREGRTELNVKLKVNNINYLDTIFIMPKLDDKDTQYSNTLANIILTYISYKDKQFIKINQL